MKFGKEFEAQMVPEWQEAYMDYTGLKTIIKDISKTRVMQAPPPKMASTSAGTLKRRASLYRAFSGLTNRHSSSPNYIRGFNNINEDDDEVILVSAGQGEGLDGSSSSQSHYQTRFIGDGHVYEQMFFKKLDDEFNKVVDFYKGTVDEVVNEATDLNKQMDALIALRIIVDEPVVTPDSRSSPAASIVSHDPRRNGVERVPLDSIQEIEMSNEVNSDEENREANRGNHSKIRGGEKLKIHKPASVEVLNHVKINVAPETPVSTLKGCLLLSDANLNFNRQEVKKAEHLMAVAFIEFYKRLRLLKSYSYMNIQAFSKILKKYDKVTSTNASKAYLKMVDNSYIGSSEEVNRLVRKVESAFTKHFANGNRQKGMEILRPKTKRERHSISFFIGLFGGCSIALIVTIFIIIRTGDIFRAEGRQKYMDVIFPLYCLFGYIVLHLAFYAGNIYYWRRYRVNYTFIFGFKNGTELGYREVLLVSSGLFTLTLAGIVSNLEMQIDPNTQSFKVITELVPLGLVIVVLAVTICPFNILFRSSRYFLLGCVFHCFLAPLYRVTLPDFFVGDQLTSLVQAFRELQFYVCYYGWGDFKTRSHTCQDSKTFEIFYYVVAVVPFWLRFLQCLRQSFEKKDLSQGANALKYLSTIVALVFKTGLGLQQQKWLRNNPGAQLKIGFQQNSPTYMLQMLTLISSIVAMVFNTYWDIVKDWGLLQRNSKHFLLRDKLLIPNHSVYFIAMVVNVILRLVWMQLVFGITEGRYIHRQALKATVACLEIIRRGIWNFFRLENEHLNNVGKYRAFKSVPLPFNYDDEEDKYM